MNLRKHIRNILEESIEHSSVISKLNDFTKNDRLFDFHYTNENGESINEKAKIIYIRFGLPRINQDGNYTSSIRHSFGKEVQPESGISVFEVGWNGKNVIFERQSSAINSSFDELMGQGRSIYVMDGEIDYNEEGADNEPIMIPQTAKVVMEIPKEIIIS